MSEIKEGAKAIQETAKVVNKSIGFFEKLLPETFARKNAKAAKIEQEAKHNREMAEIKHESDKLIAVQEEKIKIINKFRENYGLGTLHVENLHYIASKIPNDLLIEKDLPEQQFMTEFVEASKNAIDDNLRQLWADILSKECKERNSISTRTLHFVKTLSRKEAQAIERILKGVCNNNVLITGDGFFENVYSYTDALEALELNIINITSNCWIKDTESKLKTLQLANKNVIAFDKSQSIRYQGYPLTKIGREILSVVHVEPPTFEIMSYFGKKKPVKQENFNLELGIKVLKPNPFNITSYQIPGVSYYWTGKELVEKDDAEVGVEKTTQQ